jgi:hypothetical protein
MPSAESHLHYFKRISLEVDVVSVANTIYTATINILGVLTKVKNFETLSDVDVAYIQATLSLLMNEDGNYVLVIQKVLRQSKLMTRIHEHIDEAIDCLHIINNGRDPDREALDRSIMFWHFLNVAIGNQYPLPQ